jgi:serine protease inhibitor
MVAKAIRSPPAQMFRVDRPFLFAIVDETTGAVLFEGRFADPRQAS